METCTALSGFQPDKSVNDRLRQSFKLPRSCLFPINNAYVGFDDVVSGHKFVVAKGDEVQKLLQRIDGIDYLFFSQNLDLLTKTCTAGLLFVVDKSLVGVLLKDGFNFLMDNGLLDRFFEVRS